MNILATGAVKKQLDKIKNCLEEKSHFVLCTKNTLEALEMIRNISPEVVICDREIQIGNPLNFPRWILAETGQLPCAGKKFQNIDFP